MTVVTDTSETAIEEGPRHAWAWALLVYVVAALTLGYPALAGQFLVSSQSDQFLAGYAFREFGAATLRETGGFPLWNPYLFGGLPYVAAMHGDIFYPTFLLRLILPTDVAMTWGFIIHLVLAGFFTWRFLRALGLGYLASLVGGLAYMMGGNVAGLVSPGHDGKLFMSALLPLALLFVLRGVRDGKAWSWGALAVTVGLAVLTPHPQLLQYLLLTSGAFGLFLAFGDLGQGTLPRPVALRRLALAAGSVIVGGLMGAIQFLPVREYVAWSPRAGGKAWEAATSYSMPPEETINFYLPHFSGILERYWGENGIHFHSEYLGVATIILATFAFARTWGSPERKYIRFFALAFVIGLFWALGGHTPFYRLVYVFVPGTKFFRAPSTMLFVVSFCSAVLAGFGAERVLRRELSRRAMLVWAAVAGLIGVLGVSGALTNLAVSITTGPQTEYALENDAALRGGAIRSTLFAVLALATIFLIGSRRLSRMAGGALLAGVLVVDLWTVERLYWQFSEPAAKLFAADATIEYVRQQPVPGRVLTLPQQVLHRDPFLRFDALMIHRVRTVGGYHGNELGRYQQLVGGQNIANPNLWRLLNVRYLLTDADSLPVPILKRVVGPVINASGTTVYLYEFTEDHPAAWIAPVIVKAPDDAVLGTVLDPRFDVRRAALFDTSAAVTGQQIESLPAALSLRAEATRYEPGAIDVELDEPAPAGSALVVSENYYPGWAAEVDGKPAVIGRADMSLIGVPLAAGARRVSLRFSSEPYEKGKSVTLTALMIGVLALGAGLLIEARRRV